MNASRLAPLLIGAVLACGRPGDQVTIPSPPGAVAVDQAYASFHDEAGVQLGQSGGVAVVPAQYVYASASKVVVDNGVTINKISSRLAWTGATPTAADLDANALNLPVLRVLVAHGTAAIVSAQAIVSVGSSPSVTVDLTADSTSPSEAQAYLLPIASNLFPALAQLTSTTAVAISVLVKDALNQTSTGGPWTINVTPLGPPVVAVVDTLYTADSDPLSVYPYSGQNYMTLWTSPSTFALDNGVRVYHVVVTNPAGEPVSLGALLGGAKSWSIAESWVPHLAATPSPWRSCTRTCTSGGSGTPTCSDGCSGHGSFPANCSGNTPICYSVAGTSWSCDAASFDSGTTTSPFGTSGTLTTSAYVAGTTSRAAVTSNGRYLVPGASGSNPGRVDLYVLRPIASDRTATPASTWVSALSAYETGELYQTVNQGSCTLPSYPSSPATCTWYLKMWDQTMSGATETLSGTIALDAEAYDAGQSAEYGPAATALTATALPATITH